MSDWERVSKREYEQAMADPRPTIVAGRCAECESALALWVDDDGVRKCAECGHVGPSRLVVVKQGVDEGCWFCQHCLGGR